MPAAGALLIRLLRGDGAGPPRAVIADLMDATPSTRSATADGRTMMLLRWRRQPERESADHAQRRWHLLHTGTRQATESYLSERI